MMMMIHELCHSKIIVTFHNTKKFVTNKIIKLCWI